MFIKLLKYCLLIAFLIPINLNAKNIYFCNEQIPVTDEFVANRLMQVIKNQIPNVTLSTLRVRARIYFPYIEYCLKMYGLPEDFKYLPIIECGFRNVSSPAGARGFWQLMPAVAREYNLLVTATIDERDDPAKATVAACKLILSYYSQIKKRTSTPSWVLTAAAYNFGIGNVFKTIDKQGNNYFKMNLNAETAEYVYRIVAVKELFEHPELYMGGFGTNIFSSENMAAAKAANVSLDSLPRVTSTTVDKEFSEMEVKVSTTDKPLAKMKSVLIPAKLVTDGKEFQDGGMVTMVLQEDMTLSNGFTIKGTKLQGTGWIIDDRIFIDLGYGREVQVLDKLGKNGLALTDVRQKNAYVLIKTEVEEEEDDD